MSYDSWPPTVRGEWQCGGTLISECLFFFAKSAKCVFWILIKDFKILYFEIHSLNVQTLPLSHLSFNCSFLFVRLLLVSCRSLNGLKTDLVEFKTWVLKACVRKNLKNGCWWIIVGLKEWCDKLDRIRLRLDMSKWKFECLTRQKIGALLNGQHDPIHNRHYKVIEWRPSIRGF